MSIGSVPTRRIVWKFFQIGLLIAMIGTMTYWVRFSPVAAVGHPLQRGPLVSEVMGTGTLEARISATIGPKISGRIDQVFFDQGDRVKADDLLVRLDDDELVQQVAIAQANLEVTLASQKRLETDKNRTLAVVVQARKHNRRRQDLLASHTVSQEEADAAIELLAVAEAGLSRSEAAIVEGEMQLIAAQKNLGFRQTQLTDTQIRAPFDGLIVRRHREAGDVVVPGNAILSLVSTDELWVSAWVDETEMEKVAVDQESRVVFHSDPDHSYAGTVARLAREADRETREFIVDVRVHELPNNWAVGQRAEVYINVQHKESVLILPTQYLVLQEGEPGAFLLMEGRAKWHPIKTGIRSPDLLEVTEGLEAGQTVLMSPKGKKQLQNGRKVTLP